MSNEIELKLRIAEADIARLRRHAAIKQHLTGKPLTRRLVSIYYDTPDLTLLDAAISLRVRRMSGGWFQAVKSAGQSVAGLHQRMEWEDIIARGEPDFSKITEPGLAALFADQALRDALAPIFTTDVRRTEWQLEYEDGTAIEVALDVGELLPGEKSGSQPAERILELELELKHGKPGHIFELALALQADIPLHIENVSKAQRGYAFYRTLPASIVQSAVTGALPAKIDAAQAFRLLAGPCVQRLQNSQEMLLLAEPRHAIEPMHSALRQLTFVLKLFRLQRSELRQELDWLGAELNAARMWDLFLHNTLQAARTELALPEGLDQLHERAHAGYKRVTAKLRRMLQSQRYQRLLLSLGACLATDRSSRKKARPLLARKLQQRQKKLIEHAQELRNLNHQKLRKLQNRLDDLRFCLALLAGHKVSSKKHSKYQRKLAQVEQSLAALEKIAVTETLAKHLRRSTDPAASLAIDSIMQWNTQRSAAAYASADLAWQALSGQNPPELMP